MLSCEAAFSVRSVRRVLDIIRLLRVQVAGTLAAQDKLVRVDTWMTTTESDAVGFEPS